MPRLARPLHCNGALFVVVPRRYWLCAATSSCIKIWDLETKSVVDEVRPESDQPLSKKAIPHHCTCLQWSADGSVLYAGYTDGLIRVCTVNRI